MPAFLPLYVGKQRYVTGWFSTKSRGDWGPHSYRQLGALFKAIRASTVACGIDP